MVRISAASSVVRAVSAARHCQLPSARPGTLMRASLPRPSQSAMGMTASSAGLASTPRSTPFFTPSAGVRARYSVSCLRSASAAPFSHQPSSVSLSWVPG